MRKVISKRIAGVAIAVLPISLLATNSQAATPKTVNVVGYSIVANAYTALENAFSHTAAGQGVTFTNSFGASTTQAQDVVAGQPADVGQLLAQPRPGPLDQRRSGVEEVGVREGRQGPTGHRHGLRRGHSRASRATRWGSTPGTT